MDKKEAKEIVKVLALSAAPLIISPLGASLVTLANECFNSSAKLRQDKWQEEIIRKLETQDDKFEDKIRNTQNFASLFANAQNGALFDLEEDKVGLYANAIINAIKQESIDNTKTHIFLNMLREFTLLHIELLKYFRNVEKNNKAKYSNMTFMNVNEVNNDAFYLCAYNDNKTLFKDKTLYLVAYNDLSRKNLLKGENSFYEEINGYVKFPTKQTTVLADEFLDFISNPESA